MLFRSGEGAGRGAESGNLNVDEPGGLRDTRVEILLYADSSCGKKLGADSTRGSLLCCDFAAEMSAEMATMKSVNSARHILPMRFACIRKMKIRLLGYLHFEFGNFEYFPMTQS